MRHKDLSLKALTLVLAWSWATTSPSSANAHGQDDLHPPLSPGTPPIGDVVCVNCSSESSSSHSSSGSSSSHSPSSYVSPYDRHFRNGSNYFSKRMWKEAAEEYGQAIDLCSKHCDQVTWNYGLSLWRTGDDSGIIMMLSAAREKPHDKDYQKFLAWADVWAKETSVKYYLDRKDWAGAEAALRELNTMKPDDSWRHRARAQVLWNTNRLLEAQEELQKALTLEPSDSVARSAVLDLLHQMKAQEEALEEARVTKEMQQGGEQLASKLSTEGTAKVHVEFADTLVSDIVVPSPVSKDALDAYIGRPREYKDSGVGLIGGTTWIYGYNIPPGPEGERLREEADKKLRSEMKLAGVKKPEDFIDPKTYNFILGIAAAYGKRDDLAARVIRDEWSGGQFSAENQALYASIRNRQFQRLDCHSNGAMVCMAAIRLGDVRANNVRLFGPQITPESLRRWQELIEEGKVKSVEIHLNKGDPVPSLSYILAGDTAIHKLMGATTIDKFFTECLEEEIRETAPRISVNVYDCSKTVDLACHDLKTYLSNAERKATVR